MHPTPVQPTRRIPHPGGQLAFTAKNRLVAAGGWPARLSLLDPQTGDLLLDKRMRTLAGFLAVSPDSTRLFTGEKTASGYTLPGLTRAPSLKGHRRGINSAAFSPDGSLIATASGRHVTPPDNTLRIWGTDGIEAARIPLPGYSRQVAFLDTDHVVVTTVPARIDLIQLSSERTVWTAENPEEYREVGPFALAGDRLVVWFSELPGTQDNGFLVLNPRTGQTLDRFVLGPMWHAGACYGLAAHPTTGHLFASVCDRRDPVANHRVVRRLDPETGAWQASFGTAKKQTGALALSPSGRWLAARLDEDIALWDLAQQRQP